MTNEQAIRRILEDWAANTRADNKDKILSNHDPEALIFDVMPPMQYDGTLPYRESWDAWQPDTVGAVLFDLHDVEITAGREVAFATCRIHCGGTLKNGTKFEDWVRATFCLRQLDGAWLIFHQHISMPVKPG